MKCVFSWARVLLVAFTLAPWLARAAPAMEPGMIYVHTARGNVTAQGGNITAPDGAPAGPQLARGDTMAATGQSLTAPMDELFVLVLSNGATLLLPHGGGLALEAFTQEPVVDSSQDRDYEPTRSDVRLRLDHGTLVYAARQPRPTSTLVVTTPLAEIAGAPKAFVLTASDDQFTIAVIEGSVTITVPATHFSDTLESGQSATLRRADLAERYPLKLAAGLKTADETQFTDWLGLARWAEARVDFTRAAGKLRPRLVAPAAFLEQTAADDPRPR